MVPPYHSIQANRRKTKKDFNISHTVDCVVLPSTPIITGERNSILSFCFVKSTPNMGLYDDVDLAEIDNMSTDSESEDDDEAPGQLMSFMNKEKKKRAQLTDFNGFDDDDDNTIVRKMKGILALRESLGMDDDKSFMAEQERKAAEKKKLESMTIEERMRYEEEQAGDVMSKIRARHVQKLKEVETAPASRPKQQAPPMPGLKPLQQAPPMPGLKPLSNEDKFNRLLAKKAAEEREAKVKKVRRTKSGEDPSAGGKVRRARRASIAGSAPEKHHEEEKVTKKRMQRRGSTGGRPKNLEEYNDKKEKSSERRLKPSSGKDPSTRRLSSSGKAPSSRRLSSSGKAPSSRRLSSTGKSPSSRKLKSSSEDATSSVRKPRRKSVSM
jgi:hypothetical protein